MKLWARCATWFDANGRRCYAAIEDNNLVLHQEGRTPMTIPTIASQEIGRVLKNLNEKPAFVGCDAPHDCVTHIRGSGDI